MIYIQKLKAGTPTDIYTPVFTEALFTKAKKKQSKCLPTNK